MDKVGATPFYDLTDYRASEDGSHVLIKGSLGSKEDCIAIKTEDVMFLLMGLAKAASEAKEVYDPEPELLSCIPLYDLGCDVNPSTGVGILRLGIEDGGDFYFEIPRGGSEHLMQTIRKRLASVSPALRKADPDAPALADLP